MKNRHVERLRYLAKQYHRRDRKTQFDYGIANCHVYGNDAPALTWWDDVAFILNDYRVDVVWIHPRQAYQDRIETEAFERIDHLIVAERFADAIPIYGKAGQSRKKVIAWKTGNAWTDGRADAYRQELERLSKRADYVVTPYCKVYWRRYAKVVELCAPMEVRTKADLHDLAALVKRLLKQGTTLEREFPGYRYTREDWMRETADGNSAVAVHAHQCTV